MKKWIYALGLFFGLLLTASESATFWPNVAGLLTFMYSSCKLDMYNTKK